MTDSILQSLEKFIANDILKQPGRAIPATEKLISSGLIDSFSLVDLSIFIDNTFCVQIDDTELTADTFDTLEQLVILIEQRKA